MSHKPPYDEVVEELQFANMLLATRTEARDKLLNAIPACPVHGPTCVPYALEWIEKARAVMATEQVTT